jgi:hypothetical protein
MYLYINFTDTWGAYNDTMLGLNQSNRIRVKRIKLTDEQIKELKPLKIGQSGDTEYFECVTPISIQEE